KRTAPTGPMNGSGETMSAADAPLMQRMSCGTTMSALSTVQITCTSLQKPFGHNGRIGRSIMRAGRIARSVGRPSRLKKPPGIFPAAYMRSSTSTVSGKKSAPSRASVRPCAVASTIVSPERTTTAAADHLEQPAARMVVLGMRAQVRGEVVDPCRQKRDLHLRRAGVGVAAAVLADDSLLVFLCEGHVAPLFAEIRSPRASRKEER